MSLLIVLEEDKDVIDTTTTSMMELRFRVQPKNLHKIPNILITACTAWSSDTQCESFDNLKYFNKGNSQKVEKHTHFSIK